MENKPILIVGPPRSGTSITARIIQEHIGSDFPFEVNRHAEPEALVDIHKRWLERNGKDFIDRFYFPDTPPDLQLFQEYISFFSQYKDTLCVIKEPLLSITLNWFQLPRMFHTLHTVRDIENISESFRYHKNFDKITADRFAGWYAKKQYRIKYPWGQTTIHFSSNKNNYQTYLFAAIQSLGMEYNQSLVDKHWDQSQIEYYK